MGVKGGPAIKPSSNMPTSIMVQAGGMNILVDAGLGVTRGICDQGVALTDIDLIIITHLHSDHYLELGPYFHTAWTAGLKRQIPVIGPTGLDAYWAGFLASMKFDIDLRIQDEGRCDLSALLTLQKLSEGVIFNSEGVKITAMRNQHPPIEESFALRIDVGDKVVVLSGDTAYMDEMVEFSKGADLLVHEALLETGVDALCASLGTKDGRLKAHLLRSHTSAANAGLIAHRAGVKKLALNHFVPGADPTITDQVWSDDVRKNWSGPLVLGKDGIKIEV
jgi:ribonuclease BN (tRNA processing enzyme)